MQFRTNSFWPEWARLDRFYHKKCAILTKFVRKLSLRALYRWWLHFPFFTENQFYRFAILKCVNDKIIDIWAQIDSWKEPSSPTNENKYIFWMSSKYISIPKIPIYWLWVQKITNFPGRITILIFMFWVLYESNFRIHLLFAPQTQFETLFKTFIYLLDASRNLWKFFKFQNLKITLSSVSALLWRSFIFFRSDFQKVKNTNLLVLGAQKIKKNTKKHQKKNKRCPKVIEDKVPIFVGAVKFLAK